MSQRLKEISGKIAIVGDRELCVAYRLLGAEDTFVTDNQNPSQLLSTLQSSDEFSLVIVSSSVRDGLPTSIREKLEASLAPLFVFMPDPDSSAEEEPLAELAKRVLGIDMKMGAS